MLAFANFAREVNEKGLDHSKPLSIPLGLLTPLNNLAGVIISDMVADIDETHEAVFQQELAKAKEQGLEAVDVLVNSFPKYGYRIESLKQETVDRILKGSFTTIKELWKFDDDSDGEEVNVLLQSKKHPMSSTDIYVIETIFINN